MDQFAYVLVVSLHFSMPAVEIPVHDCGPAFSQWMSQANAWAVRSGIAPDDFPRATCYRRVDVQPQLRTASR